MRRCWRSVPAATWVWRAYQRRSRRKALLKRLDRIAYEAVHQVLVPDGMGGYIHIDHLLLTAARTAGARYAPRGGADLRRRSDERLDRHGPRLPLHVR